MADDEQNGVGARGADSLEIFGLKKEHQSETRAESVESLANSLRGLEIDEPKRLPPELEELILS